MFSGVSHRVIHHLSFIIHNLFPAFILHYQAAIAFVAEIHQKISGEMLE